MDEASNRRMHYLEREVRRLKWSIPVMVLALSAVLLFIRTPLLTTPTVAARSLVIVDGSGMVRAVLGVNEEDSRLSIYDKSGRAQIELAATPHGPIVSLSGTDGRIGGALGTSAAGGYFLVYGRGSDKPMVAASVTNDGPLVALYDRDGQERATLRYTEREPTSASPTSPAPALVLSDGAGSVLFKAP